MVWGVFQSKFRQRGQHPELTSRASGCFWLFGCVHTLECSAACSQLKATDTIPPPSSADGVCPSSEEMTLNFSFDCKPLAFVNHTFVLDKPNQMSLVSQWGMWFTCWPVVVTLLYSLRSKLIRKALRQSGDAVLYMKQLSRTNSSGWMSTKSWLVCWWQVGQG